LILPILITSTLNDSITYLAKPLLLLARAKGHKFMKCKQCFRKACGGGSSPATGSILNRVCGNGLRNMDWLFTGESVIRPGADEQSAQNPSRLCRNSPKLAFVNGFRKSVASQKEYFCGSLAYGILIFLLVLNVFNSTKEQNG